MASQVAVAEVAVVPTFKGFRRVVSKETDTSAKTASQGFSRIFSKTGADTGKTVGTGFKKAFEESSKGTSDRLTKALQADVAKTSRALSAARLKEQDAAGKVRVAESQLAEARKKYASDSSQVVRAEERMATASRQLQQAHGRTEEATDDLKRAQGELARAADRTSEELADAGKRGVKGFQGSVVGGVKGFAGPLTAAFAALGIGAIAVNAFNDAKDFLTGSIDLASDVNESVNAVRVAYGEAADEVLNLGQDSAKAFGLSRRNLNQYSTQFSAFVKTIAGSGGDVAKTLETLVGRGTDFASVFNVDVADALGLFQSGLAGETEPLRKYGIDLSAAAVEAYAMANGIGDGTRELTEAEKVQARYGSLLEQTNAVAGDFVATSDELANKNRINAAEWENVRAKLGDAFLPVAQELAGVLGDDVIPVIADLAEKHGPSLAKAFEDIAPALSDLAEKVLPMLPGVFEQIAENAPTIIEALTDVLPMIIDITGKFANGATQISDFFNTLGEEVEKSNEKWENGANQWGEFFANFGAALDNGEQQIFDFFGSIIGAFANGWNQISTFFSQVIAAFDNGWNQISTFFGNIGAAFQNGGNQIRLFAVTVGAKVQEVIAWFRGLPGRVIEALGNLGNDLVASGRSFMDGFIKGIKSAPVGQAVSGVLDWVSGFFPHSPAKRGPLSGSGWTAIRKSGEAYWDQWLGGMGGDGPTFPGFPGAGGGPAFPGGAVAAPAGAAAVYVQNPWGPEYMRAQTAEVARGESAAVVGTTFKPYRRGGRRR